MSAQAAHAGPMARSVQKNVADNRTASSQVSCTQIVESTRSPARVSPSQPLKRRPHLRADKRTHDTRGEKTPHRPRHDAAGRSPPRQPLGYLRGELAMVAQIERQQGDEEITAEAIEPIH